MDENIKTPKIQTYNGEWTFDQYDGEGTLTTFDGKILKSGTSEFLANDEEAKRLYLGERFAL